jgi:hypothetical protein
MDRQLLRSAIIDVWAILYVSTTQDLDLDQLDKLRDAATTVDKGWPQDDSFRGRASALCGDVRSCGVFGKPPRKPKGIKGIMGDCDMLRNYLDSN